MREVEFVQIDVFTDRPFAGNQLAVFLDGRGVSTQEMQTIAREMNFSESTFILPPSTRDSHAQLRIFSTTKEMPMAGHPVVGTALVLYELQRMGAGRYIFHLAVGPVEVFVEVEKTVPTIWMNQGLASFGAMWSDRQGLAGALGLGLGDLADLPIQIVSTGVPYLIVPIRDLESLGKTHSNQGALRSALGQHEQLCVYLFTPVASGLRARMFDPTPNELPEDPATGSAAGPLAAYARNHLLALETEVRIEQGEEMGRPSLIRARIRSSGSGKSVLIGGTGQIVGRGQIFLS